MRRAMFPAEPGWLPMSREHALRGRADLHRVAPAQEGLACAVLPGDEDAAHTGVAGGLGSGESPTSARRPPAV